MISVSVLDAEGSAVERKLSGVGPLRLSPRWGERLHLDISEDGTCGCSMMDDNDGTDPDIQRIRPDLLEPLVATVTELAKVLPGSFAFTAMWIGDKTRETREVRLSELLELIRRNRLRATTTYAVVADV